MFKKVVWASDGSEHADRALGYAEDLVRRNGGILHVVHIVEKLVGPRVAGQNANLDEAGIEEKITEQARAAEREGVRVTLHVAAGREGEIARRIAEVAAEGGADLIVVGTRGRSAVLSAIVGSVTQRLLHVATCPVLAVPPIRDGREASSADADAVTTA